MENALPAAPAAEVTVQQLDTLVIEYFKKRKEKEEREARVKEINKEIVSIEGKLVTYLKALGRRDYKHAAGSVRISPKWSVSMPQTDADKAALFQWLREKGIYDKYATVNSAALQSLFNAEREAAIAADPEAALTFSIPGVGPAKLFEGIGKTKGKGEIDE